MKIIGVTKCPTGIAHTYMAAARIEKECERLGYEVKVETQGSQGTENKLTKREIAKADYVIIAADVVIEEPERFYGKWVLKTRIKPLLKNTQGVFERLEQDSFIMGGASFQNENNQNRNENSGNIENFQNKNAKDKNVTYLFYSLNREFFCKNNFNLVHRQELRIGFFQFEAIVSKRIFLYPVVFQSNADNLLQIFQSGDSGVLRTTFFNLQKSIELRNEVGFQVV